MLYCLQGFSGFGNFMKHRKLSKTFFGDSNLFSPWEFNLKFPLEPCPSKSSPAYLEKLRRQYIDTLSGHTL